MLIKRYGTRQCSNQGLSKYCKTRPWPRQRLQSKTMHRMPRHVRECEKSQRTRHGSKPPRVKSGNHRVGVHRQQNEGRDVLDQQSATVQYLLPYLVIISKYRPRFYINIFPLCWSTKYTFGKSTWYTHIQRAHGGYQLLGLRKSNRVNQGSREHSSIMVKITSCYVPRCRSNVSCIAGQSLYPH